MRTFQQIIVDAGHEPQAYSGRGMGGEQCLAVAVDALLAFVADIIENLGDGDEHEEAAHLLRRAQTDALGRGVVVYFPGVPYRG